MARLAAELGVAELVYLATCNRVEVLYRERDGRRACDRRRDVFRVLVGREPQPGEAEHQLRGWHGEGAVEHLFVVAAGLDSAQLGEREIQGQLRDALNTARAAGTAGGACRPPGRGGAARRPPGPPRLGARRRPPVARRDRRRPRARALPCPRRTRRGHRARRRGADRRLADDPQVRRVAGARAGAAGGGQPDARARPRARRRARRADSDEPRRVPRPPAAPRGAGRRHRLARGGARPRRASRSWRRAARAASRRSRSTSRCRRTSIRRRRARPASRASAWTRSTPKPTASASAAAPRPPRRARWSTRRSTSCAIVSPSGSSRRCWRASTSATARPRSKGSSACSPRRAPASTSASARRSSRWAETLAKRLAHLPTLGLRGLASELGVEAVGSFLAAGDAELFREFTDIAGALDPLAQNPRDGGPPMSETLAPDSTAYRRFRRAALARPLRARPQGHPRRRQLARARLPRGRRHAALPRPRRGRRDRGRRRPALPRLRRLVGTARSSAMRIRRSSPRCARPPRAA